MGDLVCGEEHSGGVWAGSNAATAADARRGIHGSISVRLGDAYRVPVAGAAGARGDEATSRDDRVEGVAIYDKVPDDGEGLRAEGLESKGWWVVCAGGVEDAVGGYGPVGSDLVVTRRGSALALMVRSGRRPQI